MKIDFEITTHPQNSKVVICKYPDGGMRHASQEDLDLWEEYQKTLVDAGEYTPSDEDIAFLAEMSERNTGSNFFEKPKQKRGNKVI